MYGWRGHIGLIVPSNNTVIEHELHRLAPNGVGISTTRVLGNRGGSMAEGPLHAMEASADTAVEILNVAKADPMIYCCMATGIIKGPGWSRQFTERLGARTEARVAAASDLTMQALTAMGARRVAIVTPYPENVASRVRPFFEAHGFAVAAETHMPAHDIQSVNNYPPEVAFRLARGLVLNGAQGLCILATDFRTIEVLALLEADLGLPVVSTNQAVLWGGLKLAGVSAPVLGFGRLLVELPALPPMPGLGV